MKVMAIVGGTGTGKSTLAAHLARRGARVIDGDAIAHDLLRDDPAVTARVVKRFGRKILAESGAVDRSRLGRVVFGDTAALAALNGILHPAILERMERRLSEFRARGTGLAVIDAALLLEVEVPFRLDLVIALRCDSSVQRRRLRNAGLDDETIRRRLESQRDLQKSFHKADIIVDTGRELALVTAEIDAIVDDLLAGNGGEQAETEPR